MQEIIETPRYTARADKLLGNDDREGAADILAKNPLAGRLVPRGAGIRKLRLGVDDRGKSSGARVIYYYHDADTPIFLLTIYAKNDEANLTDAELATLAAAIRRLKDTLRKGK